MPRKPPESRYRSVDSYRAKTPEARARQLANLTGGKIHHSRKRVDPPVAVDYRDRPAAFRDELRVLDNGQAFGEAAESWQQQIQTALDRTDDYRFAYVQLPRGHDKTGSMAFRALFDVHCAPPGSEVMFYAADEDQARIALRALKGDLRRNPMLADGLTVFKSEVVNSTTESRISVEASDAASSYGIKPYRVYCDELHAWRVASSVELWESLISATGKNPDCRLIVTTNAGFDFTSVCRTVFELSEDGADWYRFVAPGWLAGWTPDSWLATMKRTLTPASYERLILNRWINDSSGFADPDAVDRCACLDSPPEPTDDGPIAVGLDLGLTKDLAVAATVQRDGSEYRLLDMQVWSGTRQHPVEIAGVESYLRELDRRFRRPMLLLDPWQLESTFQRLSHEMRVQKFRFTEGNLTQLTEVLWRAVNESRVRWWPSAGRIVARGRTSDLTSEVKALIIREKSYGQRIDHQSSGTSDRSVALGMAVCHLAEHQHVPFSCWRLDRPDEAPEELTAAERRRKQCEHQKRLLASTDPAIWQGAARAGGGFN